MEFGVLGPLEVRAAGRRISISGPRQTALLAVLLLHANEVVSRDRLIDALWDGRPPESAENALHRVVSQLRKTLDAGDGAPMPLVTRPPGYALEVEPEELDLVRFEQLAGAGRGALGRDDPDEAARVLREGLALWRGPPLAGLEDAAFARGEIGRLRELRWQVVEDRIDADLALGRATHLVPELQALVAREPFRERLRYQLMLALYRSGRQADALAAYRAGRRLLVDELGIEPGPRLRELEGAILRQDPALDGPSAEPPPTALAPGVSGRRRRRLRLGIVLAASLAVAAVVAVPLALLGSGSGARALAEAPENSVAVIDPATNRLTAAIPVGSTPVAVAVGDGAVWAANSADGTLSRIDPGTRKVVRTVGLGTSAIDVAVGEGSVWVANGAQGTVTRVDPRSGAVVQTVRLPRKDGLVVPVAQAVTVGSGSVWVTSGVRRLIRLDPRTGRATATSAVPVEPVSLAAGQGGVWVGTLGRRVARIDPGTSAVTAQIPVAGTATAVAAGAGAVWATVCCETLWRIEPLRGIVTQTISVGMYPFDVAVGAGAVWVANYGDGTVSRIDPRTRRVVATIPVGHGPIDLAVGDGAVWVAVQRRGVN
jgi:YVTN family beta-propeller protein